MNKPSSLDYDQVALMTPPILVDRPAQPTAAIHASAPAHQLAGVIDRSFRTLSAWLSGRGLEPAGGPYVRYLLIDMGGELELELGVPVAAPVRAAGDVLAGTLPAGRYAVVVHEGHYAGLREATALLLQSAQGLGVAWDTAPSPRGDRFAARLETYFTDPAKEPDPARWRTEIAIKTR
jgi:effector-binding domain-containing protein